MTNTTIYVCEDTLVNPTGFGNYPANLNVSTTVCPSLPNQCIQLDFIDFELDLYNQDILSIYDGENSESPIIKMVNPENPPGIVASTELSQEGCITLNFKSTEFQSFNRTGFRAVISCVNCQEPPITSTICSNANLFCISDDETFTFPSTTDILYGQEYGCILNSLNPVWMYFKILEPGNLIFEVKGSPIIDNDFIAWGPFFSLSNVCENQLSQNNIVDCSYSVDSVVTIRVQHAFTGQYYMLLITNYSNVESTISIAQVAGSGSTNCISTLLKPIAKSNSTFKIFPNPVENIFTVVGVDLRFEVQIFDHTGQLILFTKNTEQIDISSLISGLYIVKNGKNTARIVKL